MRRRPFIKSSALESFHTHAFCGPNAPPIRNTRIRFRPIGLPHVITLFMRTNDYYSSATTCQSATTSIYYDRLVCTRPCVSICLQAQYGNTGWILNTHHRSTDGLISINHRRHGHSSNTGGRRSCSHCSPWSHCSIDEFIGYACCIPHACAMFATCEHSLGEINM